jgi:TPR repeat protein
MKRAALYLRVSTLDQHPETQLHDLRKLALQRGLQIVHEFASAKERGNSPLAAAQGETASWIKLAYMLSEGRGTNRDLESAYAWVTAATLLGDDRGRSIMLSLEAQLSKEQIVRGTERARSITPQDPLRAALQE